MGSKAHTWQKRLAAKGKANAMRERFGSHTAVVTRTKATYADKAVAMREHRDLIHGFEHANGKIHNEGGVNPIPRITDIKKDGSEQATTFAGDGLPIEVARTHKTNHQRAQEDKRAPLSAEMKEGWRPRRFGERKLRRQERFGRF